MEWSTAVQEHFSRLAREIGTRGPTGELIALLASGHSEPIAYHEIVERHGVARETWFRQQSLDLVLGYARACLETGALDANRQSDISHLKEFMDVGEGEFATQRPAEVASLLQEQLEMILADGVIDENEDLYQVELQKAFDLGYDQYLLFTRVVLERVWARLSHMADNATDLEAGWARRRLYALEPLYRLAVAQPRTLGTLY
jgi:hypothetical protein